MFFFLIHHFKIPIFQHSKQKQLARGAWIDRILHSGKDSAVQDPPISLEQAGNFK
jgi:hypothetical protein